MDQIEKGWFAEKEAMWPGQRFSLEIEEVLHHEKSQYQDILVFQSKTYGRVLVLDGVIQLTERDEFAYQEMIVHLPLFAHKAPKNVLLVGGGDGGALREICRHNGVEKIVMCELDERVVEVCKKFFPTTLATAFNDPRVELLFKDAAVYMKENKGTFDAIIVDCSDPVGPAEALYSSEFYQDMHDALRDGGIVCTQGECQWLHLDLIDRVLRDAKKLYPVVDYAYACVPTYPDGQIGFVMAVKSNTACPMTLRTPKRAVTAEMASVFRYYTQAAHKAAFVLPKFAESKLAVSRPASSTETSGCPYKIFRCPFTCTVSVLAVAGIIGLGATKLIEAARR